MSTISKQVIFRGKRQYLEGYLWKIRREAKEGGKTEGSTAVQNSTDLNATNSSSESFSWHLGTEAFH